jgi:hypothetical protein
MFPTTRRRDDATADMLRVLVATARRSRRESMGRGLLDERFAEPLTAWPSLRHRVNTLSRRGDVVVSR